MIKLGCFDRPLDDWVKDFWNNDLEFPNDGSEKSNNRLQLFNAYKKIIKGIK